MENKENWQNGFESWLNNNYQLSSNSIYNYLRGSRKILEWFDMDFQTLLGKKDFSSFKTMVLNNPNFIETNNAGNRMYSTALNYLEEYIAASSIDNIYPDEIKEDVLIEGATKTTVINSYERNTVARQRCIDYHGATCQICGFDFQEKYGEQFQNIIHVHHIKPLSEISQEYIIDPIKDLLPVCPNCHTIIHCKKDGTYTIDEVKSFLESAKR